MMQFIRGISAAQFAGIALLFFLPFIEVSCSNMLTIEITGQQFATGGKVDVSVPDQSGTPSILPNQTTTPQNRSGSEDVKMKPAALIAWILAFAGVALSLMAGRAMRMASTAVGFLGAVAMFWLKSEIDADFARGIQETQGLIRLEYEFAFWACVFLFITAAATNVFAILRPPDAGRS
jgi:hypothetical protein